jgi:hypothetical protein
MKRSAPLLLLLLGCFFLFKNLDDYLLWQDEANAALLGKNILAYGFPQVFDGRNLLLSIPSDVDESLIYRLWGWLPLYINALSYWIFGISTWGARFPYVLMGLGFFAWTFLRVRTRKPLWVAALFLGLNVFSVPLLLHFRQCQYYAPSIILVSLLYFLGEGDLTRPRRKAAFVLASLLLFHTQLLIWLASMAGSGARHLVSVRQRTSRMKDLVWTYVLALLIALPGLYIYRPWEFGADYETRLGFDGLAYLKKMLIEFANLIDPIYGFYAFAIAAQLVLLAMLVLKLRFAPRVGSSLAFFLVYFMFVSLFSRHAYFRYFAPLIPVFHYGLALITEGLVQRKRILGLLFLASLVLTNVLQIRISQIGKIDGVLGQYLYEVTHENSDVNKVIVGHLEQHSRPEDVVFTNYGVFPIIYYTDLVVGGGPTGYLLPSVPQRVPMDTVQRPDWIVIRRSYPMHKRILLELVDRNDYERVTLGGVDTIWGNRPSPYDHHFDTPTEGPPIEFYRKSEGS